MKFSIERAALLKAVSQAQSVVERRNTIPILANVLIEAEGSDVSFRATDLDIEVVDKVGAQVERAGATTVSATLLHEIVRKLPDGALINLTADSAAGRLTVEAGRSNFSLATLPREDFPVMASSEYASNFSAPAPVLRRLFDNITISNAICFAPCGTIAYYTDTIVGKLMATDLDADGWPTGKPRLIVDLSDEDYGIDGAVVDADGNIWNAQWGASRVAQYAPDGTFLQAVIFPASQTSCPAFGGTDLKTLYCTSATQGMTAPATDDGKTFATPVDAVGQAEHQVIL